MRTSHRETIIVTARDLFTEKGYAATSLADIAKIAHVSKAAIFYHFRTKEDILEAILAEPLAQLTDLAERATSSELSPREILQIYITNAVTSGPLLLELSKDLSVQAKLVQHDMPKKCHQLVVTLAGPKANQTRLLCAQAAFAVVQSISTISLQQRHSTSETQCAELLEAALRALGE